MRRRLPILVLIVAFISSCARVSQPVTNKNVAPSPSPSPSPQSTTRLPAPSGFVNDYANVIDEASEARLVNLVMKLRDVSKIEFAIVTIDTTKGEPIADYSLAVAREWGVGPKNSAEGGGLLLLLAIKDRQWHLQVSRALEKDLPNDVVKKLGDASTPLYRQANYASGIEKVVNAIIARLAKQRKFSMK